MRSCSIPYRLANATFDRDLGARESRATVQAPLWTRPPPPPAQTGKVDPCRPLLPAPIEPRGDRDPPAAVWDDGHERVLVARQRRAPVAAPPLHQVPQARRMWKEIGKASGWKHPRTPSVRLLWDGRTTAAVLEFLRTARVGRIGAERVPPEEEGGEETEGEPGPPWIVHLFLCLSFVLLFSWCEILVGWGSAYDLRIADRISFRFFFFSVCFLGPS